MSAPTTTRITAGVYEINGTSDADGKPYRVEYVGTGGHGHGWQVVDSRGRDVSWHEHKSDAVASMVEVGA
jgi:hypothetical protein